MVLGDKVSVEIKFRCKDCKNEVIIPKKVFDLMKERGESLPERCDICRKEHKVKTSEIKHPYFQVDPDNPSVSSFNFFESAFTSHGNRDHRREEKKQDLSQWGRITREHILELYQKLEQHQVVIVASPTGTGKSTYIPYRLIEPFENYQGDFTNKLIRRGQLIQTQPLSSAVERIPDTIAKKLLGEVGAKSMMSFGLRHRGKEEYDPKNICVIVTDGSLRNWIRDGHLGQYSLLMIDEAHKRTLNIDSLLSLLKKKLLENPQVRLIISSATINIAEFKEAFEEEGILVDVLDLSESLGKEKNYHVHYWKDVEVANCDCWLCRNQDERANFWGNKLDPPVENRLPGAVTDFVLQILRKTRRGSILVFLPGEATIRGSEKLIVERKGEIDPKNEIAVIPIYRRLGEKEVNKRFEQIAKRRVLLCTDIAETSHTLEDIVFVIDSGYIKQTQWDPETEVSSLPTIRHSQAGCKQRWGRTGRVQRGYVFCLYTEDQFNFEFEPQTLPEVLRNPLDDFILTLKAAGIRGETPLISKPEKEEKLKFEIERSLKSIKKSGFIDDNGNVTEEGLEIFHTPVSSQNIALINPADEQNCLLEMMTMLFLASTPEGEVRTGQGLYHPLNGLFVWDSSWDAKTKMEVYRIQRSFQACCEDDLDLVIKLALCFQKTSNRGKERIWGLRNFINYQVLKETLSERDNILNNTYRVRVTEISQEGAIREINIEFLSKLRSLLANILNDKIADLNLDNPYTFKLEDKVGLVSKYCSGNWALGQKNIIATISKDEGILNGQKKPLPIASFLVKIPRQNEAFSKRNLFLDQIFPVGSRVRVNEANGRYFISYSGAPKVIEVEYNKVIEFEMFLEDYLRTHEYIANKRVSFDDSLRQDFTDISVQPEAIWSGEGKSREAKIVEWQIIDGVPKAIISPLNEQYLRNKLRIEKRVGDTLEVRIEKVYRDPNGRKGWVLSKTRDELEVPIEISELSFSDFGYGLEQLEGEWLGLTIKDFDLFNRPKLTNLNRVLEDFKKLKKEIEEGDGKIKLFGCIEDIDRDRKTAFITVTSDKGVVHTFEVGRAGLPTNNIDILRIGTKVAVTIFLGRGKPRFKNHELSPTEISTLPKKLKYDSKEFKIWYPCYLEMDDLKGWSASNELTEPMIKESWRYPLLAKFSILQEGDIVEGEVIEITRQKESNRISGATVKIVIEGVELTGFVPRSKLKEMPQIGQKIELTVISAEGADLILAKNEYSEMRGGEV